MAKITMDTSEYEVMIENKKLLEDSLKRERDLQGKLEELNAEKIKALEDAKMKVIKVNKTVSTEHLLRKKEDYIIVRDLSNFIGLDISRCRNLNNIGYLIDAFFERKTTTSTPSEEITTHGLDDVIVELRADIDKNLNKSIKDKLEKAESALSLNDTLLKENKNLLKEVKVLKETNDTLNDSLAKANEYIEKRDTEISAVSNAIMGKKIGFWNKGKILSEVADILDLKLM